MLTVTEDPRAGRWVLLAWRSCSAGGIARQDSEVGTAQKIEGSAAAAAAAAVAAASCTRAGSWRQVASALQPRKASGASGSTRRDLTQVPDMHMAPTKPNSHNALTETQPRCQARGVL